jgi:hypothetical protein
MRKLCFGLLLLVVPLLRETGFENPSSSSTVPDATTFPGSDFSQKVTACLAKALAGGALKCDATNFTPLGPQVASQNIVVGDGTHRLTLYLPCTEIKLGSYKLIYDSYSTIVGCGPVQSSETQQGTDLFGTGNGPVVQPADGGGTRAVTGATLENFSIYSAGTSLEVGGETSGAGTDVQQSTFMNLQTRAGTIALTMAGPKGCTCYNNFYNNQFFASVYGIYSTNRSGFAFSVNHNNFWGGRLAGATGIYDQGLNNKFIGVDIENAKTNEAVFAGARDILFGEYEENDGPLLFAPRAQSNLVFTTAGAYYSDSSGSSGAQQNYVYGSTPGPSFVKQSVHGFCTGTLAPSTTVFPLGLGGSLLTCTDPTYKNTWTPTSGTIVKNLYVTASAPGVNSFSGKVTVGSLQFGDSNVTCTLGTSTTCNDTTHTASAGPVSKVYVKVTSQAHETLANISVSFEMW